MIGYGEGGYGDYGYGGTVTEPLTPPTSPSPQAITLIENNKIGLSVGEFSGQQQIYDWGAEWWEAEVSLPPMKRPDAEKWIGFLTALRGRLGTFYLGDPAAKTPRGVATGTPVTSGNKLLYSADCGNDVWANRGEITAGKGLGHQPGPDGVTLVPSVDFYTTGVGQYCDIGQVVSGVSTAGNAFTFSIYLMTSVGPHTLYIYLKDGAGTAITSAVSCTTAGMGTWGRFTISGTASGGAANGLIVGMYIPPSSTGFSFYAADAQLETGLTATTYMPTVARMSNSAGDGLIYTAGWTPDTTGILLRGDYIQVGSTYTQRLYKLLSDIHSDSLGCAILDIFPCLRETLDSGSAITLSNTRGVFRLSDNSRKWSCDSALIYRISFSAVEAI